MAAELTNFIGHETWADFNAFAAEAGITVARAVGLLVDDQRGEAPSRPEEPRL